jgi:hypothetical protein
MTLSPLASASFATLPVAKQQPAFGSVGLGTSAEQIGDDPLPALVTFTWND